MAGEIKPQEKKAERENNLSTLLKVLFGLALLTLGAGAIIRWGKDLLVVIKGCMGMFLVLAGIITLAIARE